MSPLEPAQSPGFLLWHAALRWQRAVSAALAPLSLTHVQFVLLASTWWLNEHGQEPTQVALATHAGTDIKMTSQVIRALERKGLVRRTVDQADTRARRVTVTDAGADLAPRAIAAVEGADEAFFAGVKPRQLVAVLSVLADFPVGGGPEGQSRTSNPHGSEAVRA
jgi:DNA-binding MarR family transcriptional regulator